MDTLYIVMPAYNEEENIKSVVDAWYPILQGKGEESRLVIADSGSTDATHHILTELKEKGYEKLEILNTDNQYHGPKLLALYGHAIDKNADYVFQTDSDGQTNPKEFDSFWEKRKNYDGIFGNRIERGDGKDRAFVEKVVCFLIKFFFGVKLPDANAPFRLMKTTVLKKYLRKMPIDYNIPNIMITTFFVYFNEKVEFEEISFKARQAGTNSVNIPKIVKVGWNALGQFRKFRKEMKR